MQSTCKSYSDMLKSLRKMRNWEDFEEMIEEYEFFDYDFQIDKKKSEVEISDNWHFMDDKPNNGVSVQETGNGTQGFVEAITNALDAVLERMLRQISEKELTKLRKKSDSYIELFRALVNHPDTDVFPENMSEQIFVVISGTTQNPSLYIIDRGTGQPKNKIHSTFNSLGGLNKVFDVLKHGKFNIGGTLNFIHTFHNGSHNLKVVLTKTPAEDEWSFTVQRKVIELSTNNASFIYSSEDGDREKMPTVDSPEHFLPEGVTDELPELNQGSIIYLPDYKLANGSVLKHGSSEEFKLHLLPYLTEIPIPFTIIDTRRNKNNNTEVYRGEHGLVEEHENDVLFDFRKLNESYDFPVEKTIDLNKILEDFDLDSDKWNVENPDDLGEIKLTANVFNMEYADEIINQRHTISWTINGQSHASSHARKLKDNEEIYMSLLCRNLSVDANFSKTDKGIHEIIFTTNRTNLADNEVADTIKATIFEELSDWEPLRKAEDELQKRGRRSKSRQQQIVKDMLEELNKRFDCVDTMKMLNEFGEEEVEASGGKGPGGHTPAEDALAKQKIKNSNIRHFKEIGEKDIAIEKDVALNDDFRIIPTQLGLKGVLPIHDIEFEGMEIEGLDAAKGAKGYYNGHYDEYNFGDDDDPKPRSLYTAIFKLPKEAIEALEEDGRELNYRIDAKIHTHDDQGPIEMRVYGKVHYQSKLYAPEIIEHDEESFRERYKALYSIEPDVPVFIENSIPLKIHINDDSNSVKSTMELFNDFARHHRLPDRIIKQNFAITAWFIDQLSKQNENDDKNKAAGNLPKAFEFMNESMDIAREFQKKGKISTRRKTAA